MAASHPPPRMARELWLGRRHQPHQTVRATVFCCILLFSTSVFRLLVLIFAWKWCGADLTRWVRPWVSLPMTISRLFFTRRVPDPLPRGRHDRWALEHTCATPQPDMRVCDRSHAHGSRPWIVCLQLSQPSDSHGSTPHCSNSYISRPFDGPLERGPSPR